MYDIDTTAHFTGTITVCLGYDPTVLADPSALQLLHFESRSSTDVTTSNDPVAGHLCGVVTNLSPFGVALPDAEAPDTSIDGGPESTTSDTGASLTFSADETGASSSVRSTAPRTPPAPARPPTRAWPSARTTSRSGPRTRPATSTPRRRSAAGPSSHRPTAAPPRRASTAARQSTTSDTGASLTFSADDTGASFECALDGAAYAACTSPAAYAGLAEGRTPSRSVPPTRRATSTLRRRPQLDRRATARHQRARDEHRLRSRRHDERHIRHVHLLGRRHRRHLRVRARRRGLCRVHQPGLLRRPGRGIAHLRRPGHRRRGQHRRHARDPQLDDRATARHDGATGPGAHRRSRGAGHAQLRHGRRLGVVAGCDRCQRHLPL